MPKPTTLLAGAYLHFVCIVYIGSVVKSAQFSEFSSWTNSPLKLM